MGASPVPQGCSESPAWPPGSAKPRGHLRSCTPCTGGECSRRCKFEEWRDVLVNSCTRSISQVRTKQLRWRNSTFSHTQKESYLNTKYSFICHRRLHTVTSVCSFFFFFSRRYLHLHLFTAWLYLHSQEYSIRNTKVREKKFLKKLVPDFRKIITQGNDTSLQCWAYRCSFDTKSSSRLELHWKSSHKINIFIFF